MGEPLTVSHRAEMTKVRGTLGTVELPSLPVLQWDRLPAATILQNPDSWIPCIDFFEGC